MNSQEITREPLPGHHRDSLTSLLLRFIKKNQGKAELSQLYEIARKEHQSNRPEAAVRTILRRLVKKGTLLVDEEIYQIAERN